MTQKKIDQLLHETYTLLYANAEPKADFNELLENATINEFGQKEIPFNDYVIDDDITTSILNQMIKKYKLNKYYQRLYSATIHLGCMPRTKINK